MPTKLNHSHAVGTLTAICMMAGIARGDGSEDCPVPAAYLPGGACPETPAVSYRPEIHAGAD